MQSYIILTNETEFQLKLVVLFGCLEMMNGSGQKCNRMLLKTKQVSHEREQICANKMQII